MPQLVGSGSFMPRVPPLVSLRSFSKGDVAPRVPREATPSKFSAKGSGNGCSVESRINVSTPYGSSAYPTRAEAAEITRSFIALVGKLIAGVVARIEELDPRSGSRCRVRRPSAGCGDAVCGGESQPEFVALMGELIVGQRSVADRCVVRRRKRRQGVVLEQSKRRSGCWQARSNRAPWPAAARICSAFAGVIQSAPA